MSMDLEFFANRNSESQGRLDQDSLIIGEGKYKYVFRGTYERSGEPSADKFLKTGTTFSSKCFDDDVHNAEEALKYVAGFYDYIETTVYRGRVSIKVNIPEVWTQTSGGYLKSQKMLREPFIANFQKFNSNSGAADLTAQVAQALSHFSYHASDGTELPLCDLQGGRVDESYVLSDAVMMSMGKKYWNTDLGAMGIENWLSAHQCNAFCCKSWKNWTGARSLIRPVFSSTTVFDASTAPAKQQDFMRIRPSHIHFTQDSIKNTFRDGHTLLETALQIVREEVGKRDIPLISSFGLGTGGSLRLTIDDLQSFAF